MARDCRIRLTWDLPVDDRVYRELGWLVHQLSRAGAEPVIEFGDAEGVVLALDRERLELMMEVYGYGQLLEEAAEKLLRRVTVTVECDGAPIRVYRPGHKKNQG